MATEVKSLQLTHGWLFPCLIAGDDIWTNSRWGYWFETISQACLLPYTIPPIEFLDFPHKEALNHLDFLVRHFISHGLWPNKALEYIVDWLLFGFGSPTIKEFPAEPFQGAGQFLYKELKLGMWQKDPFDYFGHYFETFVPAQFNPTAIFMTPMTVCKAVAQITFCDIPPEEVKGKTVLDPCCGSGRMLLVASNWSLCLYGQDIDRFMVKITEVNAYLYVPWLARPSPWRIEGISHPDATKVKQAMEITRQSSPALKFLKENQDFPKPKHKADQRGQLLLFEFEDEKGGEHE